MLLQLLSYSSHLKHIVLNFIATQSPVAARWNICSNRVSTKLSISMYSMDIRRTPEWLSCLFDVCNNYYLYLLNSNLTKYYDN